MEAFTALRLSASPRRGYLADDEEYALATPYASPRRAFARAGVEEAPLGEVRAAVPFVWELVPGKAKSDGAQGGESSDETEDERGGRGSSSSSNSVTTESTDSTSHAEFEFSSGLASGGSGTVGPCRAAEELFSNGQLLPLRLPPRLQAVRNLRNADSDSGCSSRTSFQSCLSPAQSPRIINAASPKKASVQGRRSSLSPMRIFTLERNPPRNNLSPDSVSSASSSAERNVNSPQMSPSSATLKDLLFTDLAMASMRVESTKMITSPGLVHVRRELLKKQQEQWNGMADSDKDDVPATPVPPLISRFNAKPRPAIDVTVKTFSQKENIGRAIFANRFGMVCNCMGMAAPPDSP